MYCQRTDLSIATDLRRSNANEDLPAAGSGEVFI